jgi:hypothetical protein
MNGLFWNGLEFFAATPVYKSEELGSLTLSPKGKYSFLINVKFSVHAIGYWAR